jgi:hypothetical protein
MLVVLIARFVAVMRSVVGFIAGANRMPFAKFMIANSAGSMDLDHITSAKVSRNLPGHSRSRLPYSGLSWSFR